MIDPTHWQRLREADTEDVTRRSLAVHDPQTQTCRLRVLGAEVVVDPTQENVAWAEGGVEKPPGFFDWLVAVVYLLSARDEAPTGQWASPQALPYGEFYFRGPHELPTAKLAEAFGSDAAAFDRAAREIGGERWTQGRHAFVLPALPRVPILIQLWEADDEFPARASFHFDRNACDHLPLDALQSLAIMAAKRLLNVGDKG